MTKTISRTDEGQLRPKYIFNYSTEVWSITEFKSTISVIMIHIDENEFNNIFVKEYNLGLIVNFLFIYF